MEPAEYWRHDLEYQRSEVLHRLEVQNQLGQAALKSMMLVNGGAIISLLTFIGNHHSVANACWLRAAMALYGSGLFFVLFAHFGAYFSQADFMNVAAHRMVSAQSRMGGGDEINVPVVYARRGTGFLYLAVSCVLISLILFGLGSAAALNGTI